MVGASPDDKIGINDISRLTLGMNSKNRGLSSGSVSDKYAPWSAHSRNIPANIFASSIFNSLRHD
jgi:hypothetical protein